MLLLLSFLALFSLLTRASLLSLTTEYSASLQNKCAAMAPKNFVNKDWIAAVVCGKNPGENSEYQLLQISGLVHFIVVSGIHLVLIEQFLDMILKRVPWSFLLKLLVLGSFALMTGFQPPVVRALVSLVINSYQKTAKLFWVKPAVALFTGLTCLIIAPTWWNSLSLQLSWTAALALQSGVSRSALKRQLAVFVLRFPLLLSFAPPHPISILYNLIAGEYLGFILFPFSAAAMLLPSVFWFVDPMWTGFFKILELTVPTSPFLEPISLASKAIIWIYIFALNLFLIRRACKR